MTSGQIGGQPSGRPLTGGSACKQDVHLTILRKYFAFRTSMTPPPRIAKYGSQGGGGQKVYFFARTSFMDDP